MNNLSLIIQREYLSIVARKSFIVMTLLIPLILVAVGAIPVLIQNLNESSSSRETVTVIDETGALAGVVENNETYNFVPLNGQGGKIKPQEFLADAGESVSAVVVIPANVFDSAQVVVYSYNTISQGLLKYVEESFNDTINALKLQRVGAEMQVPNLNKIVDDATVEVNVASVKVNADGSENDASTLAAMLVGIALSFITYMFVLSYGAMIMNSVIEEKTNRIVEVIVSSCKPFQLMMGKIIGVALAGLTQFAIWAAIVVAALSWLGSSEMEMVKDVVAAAQSINLLWIVVAFVIYFIGGYLLYASLFAAGGSAVDQASDASQFSLPIMMLMVVALYAGMGCMENPGGTMAEWCSMIPFTSPIVMMIRLPYEVPVWQVLVSVGALYATAFLMIWLSARIYRTGILLYGKKHSLKDIIRWIK